MLAATLPAACPQRDVTLRAEPGDGGGRRAPRPHLPGRRAQASQMPCDPSAACRRMPGSLTASRSTSLRTWQHRALERLADWREGPFLISAAPGAGKTRPALELARDLLSKGIVGRVAVLCPTTPLTRQWATAAARARRAAAARRARAPTHHATSTASPSPTRAWRATRAAGRPRCSADTLVIVDEAHHLGEDLAWGTGFQQAFASAPRWLLLSGTPFRSDATPIPGVRYDHDGAGGARRLLHLCAGRRRRNLPAGGVRHLRRDAVLAQRRGRDRILVRDGTDARARPAAAIAPRSRPSCRRGCRGSCARPTPSCGRCARRATATRAGWRSRPTPRTPAGSPSCWARSTGRAPVVVLHTETKAARKLADFRGSREPWIVAVNMVSEGVDIPRLRVGVYATAAKTPLIFRQIVGRFVRTIPTDHRPAGRAELAVPARRPDAARSTPRRSKPSCATRCAATSPRKGWEELRAAARERALASRRVRAAERRVRRPDDAVRPAPSQLHAPRRPPGRRARRPSRPRWPRSSAAPSCARSAAAWWPNCTAATGAATARSTPGSTARSGSSASRRASIKQLERSIHALTRELTRGRRPSRA